MSILRSPLVGSLVFSILMLINLPASADTQIPAVLRCSALSNSPVKWPSYESDLTLNFSGYRVSAERLGKRLRAREVYSGVVRNNGDLEITSRGSNDAGSVWTSKFSGQLKGDVETRVEGVVVAKRGTRHCSITIASLTNEAQRELGFLPVLSSVQQQTTKSYPQIEPAAAEAINQSSQDFDRHDRPISDQGIAVKEAPPPATNETKPEPHSLSSVKQVDATSSSSTGQSSKSASNVLGNLVLPLGENPSNWMMRVGSVPVQQQQFCRVIDRFYDDLTSVYRTRNDIKKNALYRDRRRDLAALLPRGNFDNWVVQVKAVTQAPDGSAAVMLQPPCRAMLASDLCRKSDYPITGLIPRNSRLYRELGKVSAGDFVLVSGKLLAGEFDEKDSSFNSGVYQAGSYCSQTSEDEDVFVTVVRYLVQLR